jgi:hypothetical protein
MEHVFSCTSFKKCVLTLYAVLQKIKNCLRTLRFRWPFAVGPTPSPSDLLQRAMVAVGHVDNVDHQFQVAWPRKPQACALPGVDNVDNHFAIVHMVHFSFAPVFFFLRGNSLRVDLWTMWTCGPSI